MKYNVFIDGAEGTTGLKIHQYFQKREDIQVSKNRGSKAQRSGRTRLSTDQTGGHFIPLSAGCSSQGRSQQRRRRSAGSWTPLRLIRTDPEWVYGMPELSAADRETRSKTSNRVAVPGCHAIRRDPAHKAASRGGICYRQTIRLLHFP